MNKRLFSLWIVLMAVTGAITCAFLGLAVHGGWTYFKLDSQTEAEVQKWEIRPASSSRYLLFATYRYTVDGKEFIGQTLFSSPCYPNQYAAELDLKARSSTKMRVWYQKKTPYFSSLYKRFPKKELTNLFLAFGVCLYFCFARTLLRTSEVV